MDENHQDKTESKLIATEDVRWGVNRKSKLWVPKHKKRTGFKGKTLWDWLDLIAKLAIPLVVVLATIGFGWWQIHLTDVQHQSDQMLAQQQHVADQQRALDQQQAVILQTYIDNIQDLLLNHNLLKSKSSDEIATLARARTLTALEGLDPQRKGRLLIFLHEAELIGFDDNNSKTHAPIINLKGANLTHADLWNTNLSGANLSEADLSHANLLFANLSNADLSNAILISTGLDFANLHNSTLNGARLEHGYLAAADLSRAKLRGATLRGDLSNANLSNANLSNDDLYGTKLIKADLSHADLDNAKLIKADLSGANLSRAFLFGDDLSGANLSGANLSGATLYYGVYGEPAILTQQQLDQVYSCKNSTLPPGLTCHHNQ